MLLGSVLVRSGWLFRSQAGFLCVSPGWRGPGSVTLKRAPRPAEVLPGWRGPGQYYFLKPDITSLALNVLWQ